MNGPPTTAESPVMRSNSSQRPAGRYSRARERLDAKADQALREGGSMAKAFDILLAWRRNDPQLACDLAMVASHIVINEAVRPTG